MKAFFILFLCLFSFNLYSQESKEINALQIVPPPDSLSEFDEDEVFFIVEVMPVFKTLCSRNFS